MRGIEALVAAGVGGLLANLALAWLPVPAHATCVYDPLLPGLGRPLPPALTVGGLVVLVAGWAWLRIEGRRTRRAEERDR